jgi:dihydroneopterin aldolase
VSAGDTIELRGLRGHGHHGVYAAERATGQSFVVDVTLWLDLADAGRSDDVTDTVHYGELATDVVAVVEGEPVQLIETLAERIAVVCLSRGRVARARVTVHKPEAPIEVPFEDVAVTVERSR